MSERPTSWQRAEEIGLAAVGVAAVVYAGWFEDIASGLDEVRVRISAPVRARTSFVPSAELDE